MWRNSKTLSPLKTPGILALSHFCLALGVKRAPVFPAIGPQASRSQGHAFFMPIGPADPEAGLAGVWAPLTAGKLPALSPSPATLLAGQALCVPPHPSLAHSICSACVSHTSQARCKERSDLPQVTTATTRQMGRISALPAPHQTPSLHPDQYPGDAQRAPGSLMATQVRNLPGNSGFHFPEKQRIHAPGSIYLPPPCIFC